MYLYMRASMYLLYICVYDDEVCTCMYVCTYVLGENQIQTDSIRSALRLRDGSEVLWKSSREKQGQRETEGTKMEDGKERKRKKNIQCHHTERTEEEKKKSCTQRSFVFLMIPTNQLP